MSAGDRYDPPAGLSPTEVRRIGQALTSAMSQDAMQIAALGPGIIAYCAEHGLDADEVLQRELARLKVNYRITQRFVVNPFPWEMFETRARETWWPT